MKIELKNTTQAGNNLATSMFFDGVRVAEIHCTPKELHGVCRALLTIIREIYVLSR